MAPLAVSAHLDATITMPFGPPVGTHFTYGDDPIPRPFASVIWVPMLVVGDQLRPSGEVLKYTGAVLLDCDGRLTTSKVAR